MSGMFDDNPGYLAHIGIPDFHELDQHLEALLLRGVRIMVVLTFLLLLRFFLSLFVLFISLLFNSYSPLLLLFPLFFFFFLYSHSMGLGGAVVLVPLCFVLMFGWLAFSCACYLRSLPGICCCICLICCLLPCYRIRIIHTLCFLLFCFEPFFFF